MSGEIVDLSQGQAPPQIETDICIVGSGSGGATAARVLAEAGRDVVVLEEGSDFPASRMTQRDGEMYAALYMERGSRATTDLGVTVLQGRVLGGGGVINASDVVPIPAGVLAHWRKHFGLSEFTEAALGPYQARALQDLRANPILPEQMNRANGLLRQGAERLGIAGNLMQHNRVGCAGLGTCLIGCPIDAKKNPRLVAIPKALAAGARFFTRARARRVLYAESELKRVDVQILDTRGLRAIGSTSVRARTVIVAANAVGSAELLLRSGIGNQHVGRHLILQPQLPIVAVFPERVEAFRGIPQSYAVTEFEREDDPEHGLWGYRIEGIMGTPGMVGSLLPFSGVEGKVAMAEYDHLAASLLLVPDEPSGAVRVSDTGRLRIEYRQHDNHKERIREAARTAARIYFAAGASRVVVPVSPPVVLTHPDQIDSLSTLPLRPAGAPLLSAHQQGSARMAPRARDGALAPNGHVYGTRGVYVFDSSGFPSSASTHTMAPIMALARYWSAQLLQHTPPS
ncbi:MAG: GMC family oxidoreductase N-terminal domain-containing protein [Polyangiaceae bacterium]